MQGACPNTDLPFETVQGQSRSKLRTDEGAACTAANSFERERSKLCQIRQSERIGRSPQPWPSPREDFPKTRLSKAGMDQFFPGTPACYGFSIIAKIIPGREAVFHEYAKNIEEAVAGQPDILAVLKLHYLRWNLFDIKGETYFQYMGIFDTDFDKYTEDAVGIFAASGLNTVFENLEGFPKDWKTNAAAFIKFVREHQRPSFLEYGEYPFVSADEIKKALKLKAAFSNMLDQMQ